jgi:hypothetical protein
MTGNMKGAGEAFNAISIVQIMDRIAVLFKRLGDLEGKLRQHSAGDGDSGLIPNILVTQLKALKFCAAISKEIHEAEALLGSRP